MDIIFVENSLFRNVLYSALDYFLFLMLLTVVGALLSGRRTTMYWFVMMSGICAFVAVLSLSLLKGDWFLFICALLFAVLLPISYFRQKKIISAEEVEKARLHELEKRTKAKEIADAAMEKISKEDPTRFMPKSAE